MKKLSQLEWVIRQKKKIKDAEIRASFYVKQLEKDKLNG